LAVTNFLCVQHFDSSSNMTLRHRDLWDTRHVKRELITNTVSERKAFAYFFAIMIFDWFQLTSFRLSPSAGISPWARADALITLAVTAAGLLFLYRSNGGKHGKDFLYRYFALSVVVGWKFALLAYVLLWSSNYLLRGSPGAQVGWTLVTVLFACNLAMFGRIGAHYRTLAAIR
jgi:hypothetical protein